MNLIWSLVTSIVLATATKHAVTPPIILPTPACIDLPAADRCLIRVQKNAEGKRGLKPTQSYACGNRRMSRGQTTLTLQFRSVHSPCDENAFGDAILRARGTYVRRDQEDLVHAHGTFTITPVNTANPIYQGTIEWFEQVGSHHAPVGQGCEKCNEPKHLEGWLIGCGYGTQSGVRLRTQLVTNLYFTNSALDATMNGTIDGLILRP